MPGKFNQEHTKYIETSELSIEGNYDVIVVGGGPAGIASALSAARHGMKVLIIESYGFLGGMWTMGMVSPFFDHENKGGLCREIVEEIDHSGMANKVGPEMWVFDIEEMKALLDRMMQKEGVDMLFHTHFASPIVEDGKITGVIVENKGGRCGYTGKIMIDCTGDGDVAARAGVPYEIGRPSDHKTQPMTLMFRMSNVDYIQDYYKYPHYEGNELFGKLEAAMKRANVNDYNFNYKRPCVLKLPGIHTALCQATHIRGLLSINPKDLTEAEIEGRKEVRTLFNLLKTYLPEFQNAHVDTTGPHIGIRESRHIMGEYILKIDDIEQNTQFDDGICSVTFWVDIHQPDSVDQDQQHGNLLKPAYQIPYRSLVPLKVENLLIAGRCISGTYEAHASFRVTGDCVAMGQAAGIAAALCVQSDISPRNLDGKKVVEMMMNDGAICRTGH